MASISAAPTSTSTSSASKSSSVKAVGSSGTSSKHINNKNTAQMSGTAGHRPSTAAPSAAAATAVPNSPTTEAQENISYSAERIIGNGSFGVVFEAKVVETNEVVAIKKVLQDKRFKNRELQIMRQLVKDPHTNIVALKHCFYSQVRRNVMGGLTCLETFVLICDA